MGRFVNASVAFALLLGLVTVPQPPDRRVLTNSIVLLERAVNALANPSADYSKILRGVLSEWPAAGPHVVRSDLTTFLDRAPAAGADFKCGADFVRYRARKELLRLKDVLLDANPQPARSQFCNAVPLVIDVARAPGAIEIYGYDFDREPPQMLLMDAFGFRDVTFALVRRAHYHLTLELKRSGLTFSAENQQLATATGHLIQHAIPVIQPRTPLCESRIEETPPGKTIGFAPPAIGPRQPSRSGAAVWANAALDYESNQVDATLCMTTVEPGQDGGAHSGCAAELVYSAESDRVIEGVLEHLEDRVAFAQEQSSDTVKKGSKRGPVDQWAFAGLRGDRPTLEPSVAIQVRTTGVVSTKTDGCVSPIAYLEAKRQHVLDTATIRRLDAQLKKTDPAIMKIRPRFAPP